MSNSILEADARKLAAGSRELPLAAAPKGAEPDGELSIRLLRHRPDDRMNSAMGKT